MVLGEFDFSDNFIYDDISNKEDEEWNFFQVKDVLIDIEKLSKTKVLVTTKNGEIILENFEYDKAKILIAVISSSGQEIINIQYDYNVWIAFIIFQFTLTCTLGYVQMLTFSTIQIQIEVCNFDLYPWLLRTFDFSLNNKIF